MDFTIATERTELGNVIQGDDHLTYPINGFQINLLWTVQYKHILYMCVFSNKPFIHILESKLVRLSSRFSSTLFIFEISGDIAIKIT